MTVVLLYALLLEENKTISEDWCEICRMGDDEKAVHPDMWFHCPVENSYNLELAGGKTRKCNFNIVASVPFHSGVSCASGIYVN